MIQTCSYMFWWIAVCISYTIHIWNYMFMYESCLIHVWPWVCSCMNHAWFMYDLEYVHVWIILDSCMTLCMNHICLCMFMYEKRHVFIYETGHFHVWIIHFHVWIIHKISYMNHVWFFIYDSYMNVQYGCGCFYRYFMLLVSGSCFRVDACLINGACF